MNHSMPFFVMGCMVREIISQQVHSSYYHTRLYSFNYLIHDFFGLIDDLLYNLLNLFLVPIIRLTRRLSLEGCQLEVGSFVAQPLSDLLAPPAPLIQHLATSFHHSLVGGALLGDVLLIKDLGVVAQVLANFGLLLLGEKGRGAWAPEELLEAFDGFFAEECTLEVIKMVTVLHLVGVSKSKKT